ncbi:hypothetical protein BD779DRAFT_1001638 [Infundibulicybe gibba]|nr:hypothetical protein BD779DRAFT_1001638 [Infundibulicybe gibba]
MLIYGVRSSSFRLVKSLSFQTITILIQDMASQTYTHDIRSLHEAHPNLPATLGNLDLNRKVLAGNNIVPEDLNNAKATFSGLKSLSEFGDPRVTEERVKTAALRVRAVENAQCTALYSPDAVKGQQAVDTWQNQVSAKLDRHEGKLDWQAERQDRQTEIQEHHSAMLKYLVAIISNTKTLASNARQIGSNCQYQPLMKTVAGDGFLLALQTARFLHPTVQQAIVPLNPPPPIGFILETFKPDVTNYDDMDILNLIVFYNEDFGIRPEDNIVTRIKKVQLFLTIH